MRKFLLLLGFVIIGSTQIHAQENLSDYDYIVVPKLFDFLYEEDQHQLNSMTKFLLNKYGFNAYFEDELPNVTRCDGLRANVIGKPGFIYSKITVVIKDCYGNELFRSEEGSSKYKEYKKAYQDALRQAFRSIEVLGVQQKDLKVYKDLKDIKETEVAQDVSKGTKEVVASTTAITASSGARNLPLDRFTYYTSENNNYLLRKTEDGYSLYQETDTTDDGLKLTGKIFRIGSALKYRTASNQSLLIVFQENKDFILVDGDKQQLFRYIDQ